MLSSCILKPIQSTGIQRNFYKISWLKRYYSKDTINIENGNQQKEKSLISGYQYCLSEVKRLDYPHFYCSHYLEPEARVAWIALRMLNIETAAIKSVTHSNPQTGELRLAWWKNAIDECYKGVSVGHQVTDLLLPSIKEGKFTKGWFNRLLEARWEDLQTKQPSKILDIENYAENTSSSLYYLGLECIGIRNLDADHAASHVGKAVGICTLINAVPFHSKHREIYIPTELTAKYNISSEMLFRCQFNEQIGNAVYDLAQTAFAHLDMARSHLSSGLPKDTHQILLPAVFYADFLDRLRRAHFNPWERPYLDHYSVTTRMHVLYNNYRKTF